MDRTRWDKVGDDTPNIPVVAAVQGDEARGVHVDCDERA